MKNITMFLVLAVLVVCVSSLSARAAQPGVTATVFNKRFIHALQPMISYDQLAKQIGTAGLIMERKSGASQFIHYHWDGGKHSSLDAVIVAGKLAEARMLAPNGSTYLFHKNGAITEK